MAIGYGSGVDGVGIVVIEYEDVVVARDGWAHKAAYLVREKSPSDLGSVNKHIVGAGRGRIDWEFFGVGGGAIG